MGTATVTILNLMKKLLLVISMFVWGLTVTAQDVIVLKNGDFKQVKVVEVGENDVKYKKWENIEGPTYTISISTILAINYQNGTKDNFADYKETKSDVAQSISEASVNISSSINNKGGKIASNISNIAKQQDLYTKARTLEICGWVGFATCIVGGVIWGISMEDNQWIAGVAGGIASTLVAAAFLLPASNLREEAELMSSNTLLQYNVNDYFAVNIQEYNFKPNKTRNFGAGVCIRF